VSGRARIVVHSLDHAKAALAAALAAKRPITLVSAPGAGASMGAAWFLALVAEAARACPGADADHVLDCADEPGAVLAALRAGAKRIRFTGDAKVREKLAAIAAASGAMIEHEDLPALDLLDARDAEAAARPYLAR
jgi:hypothetical protein